MKKQNRNSMNSSLLNKAQPVPPREINTSEAETTADSDSKSGSLQHLEKEAKVDNTKDSKAEYEASAAFKSEVERFIEISKYFSSPLRKTASYICENQLVTYPNPCRVEYKRGGVTTEHVKFSNITLEPVYIKLYKVTPDLEQLKFINLSLSRCMRIPPGLSYNLGFVYDDVNEKPSCNAKMIFVASRKSSTPCYHICEIDLQIDQQKVRLAALKST